MKHNSPTHSPTSRPRPSLTLAAAVLLLTIITVTTPAYPAALPPLTIPAGFGVNIHFRGEPHDLDLIQQAGFRFIRMDLTWAAVEQTKGRYDFEKIGYDALTAGCTKRAIRILYILDYSNKLYESDRSVRTDSGRKAFAAFARAAAERYANRNILWEIWNEPNLKHFWSPQPSVDDYCKLVAETAPKIRNADPSALILAPACSGIPLSWLEQCFQKGLLRHIDALSVHPYRSKAPETVIADYQKLRALIARYAPAGKTIPVLSGEWGYSNLNWDKSRLSNEQQARYLVRELLVNLYQKIPVSIWYDWKNDGTNPDEREHNFGTVTHQLQPKAAYLAAKTLTSTLAGYHIEKRLPLSSDNDFALLLKNGNKTAYALWTTADSHPVNLSLPPTRATLIQMLGDKTNIRWNQPGPTLQLSQSPQYLLLHNPPPHNSR